MELLASPSVVVMCVERTSMDAEILRRLTNKDTHVSRICFSYFIDLVRNKIRKKCIVTDYQCTLFLIHVEHFRQGYGYRRIVGIHLHDICHIVPPFLYNRGWHPYLARILAFVSGRQRGCWFLCPSRWSNHTSTVGQSFF